MRNLYNILVHNENGKRWRVLYALIVIHPFWIIHELSHVIVNWILGVKMQLTEFHFLQAMPDGYYQTTMNLRVMHRSEFRIILGSLAPSIVWIGMVVFFGYSVYTTQNLYHLVFLVGTLLSYKEANCSKGDMNTVKAMYKKMVSA